jgi:hypothetical protein
MAILVWDAFVFPGDSQKIAISLAYAVAIRVGRARPHPRHWLALAKLGGFSTPVRMEGDAHFHLTMIRLLKRTPTE